MPKAKVKTLDESEIKAIIGRSRASYESGEFERSVKYLSELPTSRTLTSLIKAIKKEGKLDG